MTSHRMTIPHSSFLSTDNSTLLLVLWITITTHPSFSILSPRHPRQMFEHDKINLRRIIYLVNTHMREATAQAPKSSQKCANMQKRYLIPGSMHPQLGFNTHPHQLSTNFNIPLNCTRFPCFYRSTDGSSMDASSPTAKNNLQTFSLHCSTPDSQKRPIHRTTYGTSQSIEYYPGYWIMVHSNCLTVVNISSHRCQPETSSPSPWRPYLYHNHN